MQGMFFGWLPAALGLAVSITVTCTNAARLGPSVRDVVEFTRVVAPASNEPDTLRALVSPRGDRAFVVTRRADVTTGRNRFDLLLLDLDADRLSAGTPLPPRRLLTIDATRDESYAEPYLRDVRWLDDGHLVFLAHVGDAPAQVFRLDLATGRWVPLTQENRPIVSYAVSGDGRRVVYAVQVANPPLRDGAASLVVGNQSFWAVKFGQHDLRSQDRHYRYYVAETNGRRPPRALGGVFAGQNAADPSVSISPDGRWALLPRYDPERQVAWAARYPLVAALTEQIGPSSRIDPKGYFSRPSGYVPRRMLAWRLDDGSSQSVIEAPDDALPGGGQRRQDRFWQGRGRSVVLTGTHLPADLGGNVPKASHVVEYFPDTGRWTVIATLTGRLQRAHAPADGQIVIADSGRTRTFVRRDDGQWRELEAPDNAPSTKADPGWRLALEEGLNLPPDLVAVGPRGRSVRLTRLNPQFDARTWGVMKPYVWQDPDGRQWDGGLMTPSGFAPGGRYPLVIQAYGFSADRFYLDGPNEWVGFTSAFAGRAFLREGLIVLAMPWQPTRGAPVDERSAVRAFMAGVRGAVDALVAQGMVDPARVGIIGWSATGERVLNLVTFSDLPIRAATMADGDANTLFSLAVTYGANDNLWARAERLNAGLPFGETRDAWIRNDPSLNTDCVRTALRIETYGPWVLNNWDVYALLRRQFKPVEMVVVPGGSHALSRPAERMDSLQGNVDWFRFWLTGEERSEPVLPGETVETLRAQYVRWREMEALHLADEARPRCVRTGVSP